MCRSAIALVAAVVSACGRIGFDPSIDALDTGWWRTAWGFRKPLVIDHGQVAGDLSAFPVRVELDDAALAAHAAPDGRDLAFVDASGQALAYELESYGVSPPHAVAWVELPDVSAAVDTVFYVYYGNPSALDQAQPAAVWSNAFVGVYHFGAGATLDVHDSTGKNDGTNLGGAAATAILGGGLAVTGGPAVTAPTAGIDESPGGLDTVTLWVNYTGPIGKSPIGFLRAGQAYDLWFQTAGCTGFNTEQGDVLGTTRADLTGRWVFLAMVFFNGVPAAGQNALYVDGQPEMLTRCTAATPASYTVGGTVALGGDPGYEMTGTLDEARIASVARSPAWIATEYANQSAPTTFVAAGPEESVP